MNFRFLLGTKARIAFVVAVLVLFIAVYWLLQPLFTWWAVEKALSACNIEAANSHFDGKTAMLAGGAKPCEFRILIRRADSRDWEDRPSETIELLRLFHHPQAPSLSELFRRQWRLGAPGSVWEGRLEIHGDRVVWRAPDNDHD